MKRTTTAIFLTLLLSACGNNKDAPDASGTFEAEEVIVSAEQGGKILQLNIKEGQLLDSNAIIGQIDVTALNIQKDEAIASLTALNEKVNNAEPQVQILQSQIATQKAQVQTLMQQMTVLNKEVSRAENLLKADAATQKQYDDISGQKSILQKQIIAAQEQVSVLQKQVVAAKETVSIQNKGILSELNPSRKRVELISEQISRGRIKNILSGTVLTKYAMAGEYTNIGKPLYKIADLTTIILRAYVSGNQLSVIQLNQKVKVLTDDGKGGYEESDGIITWISDKAEFTPKTIQTKDERANLVYAVKISVRNDGRYKIGMYGEIKF
jgi:HlyD family secretion protein